MEKKRICPFISNPTAVFSCLGQDCQLWDKEISDCIFVAISENLSLPIKLESERINKSIEEMEKLRKSLVTRVSPKQIEENSPIDKL